MENRDYIVAIDLGDSNVVIAVGLPAPGGLINIEYIVSEPSSGVNAGKIENIELAIASIRTALEKLRRISGIIVLEAYAGISGEFIQCSSHTDHVFVPDHKNGVTQQVVDALFERMSNVMVAEDRIIMDRIPQRYVINDTTEVDNPVGVFGSPLSSTFNFISSNRDLYMRLDMALRRIGITPLRILPNAVVVGDAVLTPDEKEEGVVVVDFGGGLIDIAIYHHSVVRYIATIPAGAKHINRDIRTQAIPERYVEPLKLRYGCALAKNAPQDLKVLIKGRSRHDQREVVVYNLAAVIESCARSLVELVSIEIAESGWADKIPYGIVLTGGSAQLKSLDELFGELTGLDVRVAEAEDVITPESCPNITSSADSTVVGLMLHGLKYGLCAVKFDESIINERLEADDRRRREKEQKEREAKEREEREQREAQEKIENEKRQREERAKAEQEAKERAEREQQEAVERAEREQQEQIKSEQEQSVEPIKEPIKDEPKDEPIKEEEQKEPLGEIQPPVTPPSQIGSVVPPALETRRVTPVSTPPTLPESGVVKAPVTINSHLESDPLKEVKVEEEGDPQENKDVKKEEEKSPVVKPVVEKVKEEKKPSGVFTNILLKISAYANKVTDGFDVKEEEEV